MHSSTYANLVGKIDYDKAIKEVKKAKNYDVALDIVKTVINDSAKLGITKNDQTAVSKVINALGTKFGVDTKAAEKVWSTSKNLKSENLNSILSSTVSKLNKPSSSSSSSSSKYTFESKTPTVTPPTYNTNTGSGVYTPVDAITTKDTITSDDIEAIAKKVLEDSKPKPWSAEQIAKYHNVYDYDRDYQLDKYNEATNTYYDTAIENQQNELNKYDTATQNNFARTLYDYVQSYDNMAATTSNKAKLAANILNTYLSQERINSQYANDMYQSIINYENQRNAELEENPYLAEQNYNTIGNFLRNYSTDYYNSAITDYVSQTKAYGLEHAARRTAAAELANAAATRYSGLTNAAATTASASGNTNNTYDALYNIYKTVGGEQYADKVMNNLYKTKNTGTGGTA